ncbi:hypothetical protein ACJ73_05461 [Blastomyces percursus]|uniref:Rhodopsin domain-containing protein n=1 Tax=Blastomyces percursus TaxID=1658174 RepID=A0A1J9Q3G6_9EURO|nr:hypothetical protein ACJ73_05461 [Blastomyces percursus]
MEDKSQPIIVAAATFVTLSWIIIGFRFYVRLTMTRWGADDFIAGIAMLAFSAFVGSLIYSATQGLGKHNTEIESVQKTVNAFKGLFIANLFYIIASGLVKISFCLSLLRVVVIGRAYVYAIYVVGAITTIFTTFYWFFSLFTCSPVSFLWEQLQRPPHEGTCRQYHTVVSGGYVHGSIICLGDITLAIVPALMLRKLNLSHRTKVSASLLLGFGAVASIATIARLVYIHNGNDMVNFLFTNSELVIWSAVEVGVSVIAVSAVTMKPLLVKYNILVHSGCNNPPSPSPRGRIHGSGDENFTCSIGAGPKRKTHQNRLQKSFGDRKISSSVLRADVIMGRSSSEEVIWASKDGDGDRSVNNSEGITEDLEMIPTGKIHKIVEFSTSRATKEPDDDPTPIHPQGQTERQ